MSNEWITNQQLENVVYGPFRWVFLIILSALFLYQVLFDRESHGSSLNQATKSLIEKPKNDLIKLSPSSSGKNVIVTIGGDVRYSTDLVKLLKKDYSQPLTNLTVLFEDSDINYVSLDGPATRIVERRKCTAKEAKSLRCCDAECFWRNDVESIKALEAAGVNAIGIENDHMLDYGVKGLTDTIENILANGMTPSGVEYTPVFQVKKCKVGLFTYNWAYQEETFFDKASENMIRDLHKVDADIKIVMMHGGNQNKKEPSELQRSFARQAIDNGASTVIGTHSRVVMDIEKYKGKTVAYGIGSLIHDEKKTGDYRNFNLIQLEIEDCETVKVKTIEGERTPFGSKVSIFHPKFTANNKKSASKKKKDHDA